jgi:predicted nucleic acid-binding protein
MLSVYLETTIPSFYHTSRRSIQSLAWRAATRRWWDYYRHAYQLRTSEAVLTELGRSPSEHAEPRLEMLDDVPRLPIVPEVERLAATYLSHRLMPTSAIADAVHVAVASFYAVDFLLTWNCTHIANDNKARHLEVLNRRLGVHVPRMVTPYTLFPETAA